MIATNFIVADSFVTICRQGSGHQMNVIFFPKSVTSDTFFVNLTPLEQEKEDKLEGDIDQIFWNVKGLSVLLLLKNSEIAAFVIFTPGDTTHIKQPQ